MTRCIRYLLCFALLLQLGYCFAQYPPAAGQPGTTAISKDSSLFCEWASGCSVMRGWQDISDQGLGYATTGDSTMAVGMAGTNGVVSLGDGGSAVLTFSHAIVNGPSWDFAVFENSFDDYFLELAFVEVSSDGITFFRFPASSLTDTVTQVGSFDSLDARKINNLAGKYRGFFGTPFDLEELKDTPGLDADHVTHIRIRDVVGSLQNAYASYDTAGRRINDPWPTPFPSSGFDLDAVGVIWNTTNSIQPGKSEAGGPKIYPNPFTDRINIVINANLDIPYSASIYDVTGKQVISPPGWEQGERISLDLGGLRPGVYICRIRSDENIFTSKIIKR